MNGWMVGWSIGLMFLRLFFNFLAQYPFSLPNITLISFCGLIYPPGYMVSVVLQISEFYPLPAKKQANNTSLAGYPPSPRTMSL